MNAAPGPTPDQFDPTSAGQYPHPSTGQYEAPQTYPNPYTANAQRTEEDPGKVLGIVSLVASLSTFLGFNFIGPVIGIITGHMARKRSREAAYGDNEMGKWGFILGLVFLGLLVLGWALGISFGIVGGLASLMAG
ncbi:DUF4190 domain-containing protein [Brevibacterium linens]|uniref:Uncharacterized protein n=2 Tax=Brevibacterium linens TaxID=1703 RepID=A0A2H1IJY5_BRELN|nr:DUF4190 domain-containing protein [Brevibacterium linens]AZT99959.1 DUF4190 domain-containing protein [Brevibacterium linens]KAB1942997.1 DUF4190 domain-containing protein [Brevibacterium linens ATCC 9172]SMX75509.1 protein of unknown function (DUF4190) [Brevibacterium linens]SMX94646.1 protein of unknown function (DUF4190) [Brevibacterium linens ATCC 9172]